MEEFSLDAVARRAGVARMTVYYQFGSKRGLLEALFDSFAARGRMRESIGGALQRADPLDALDQIVAALAQFYDASRIPIRRVRALAILDPELEEVIAARDQQRQEAMRAMAARLATSGLMAAGASEDVVDVLTTLTSFEFFDALAGKSRDFAAVVPLIQKLCRAALTA